MLEARRLAGAGLGALGLTAAALVAPSVAQAQPVGPPLVDETFTGATADADFLAYGSACLTGAPADGALPPGGHPLGGCPAASEGPVPPPDGAPYGYLRLTDASRDQAGAVLHEQAIPATRGLVTTFEQWQYGGATEVPADGISFFLIDGSASLTAPGAFGGSLGYAQKLPDDDPANPFLPGVDHGYLGVGLDVLGNYFGDWEQRGNGCAERSPAGTVFRVPAPGPDMVTLRGPGNGTEGYCFLTATTGNFTTEGPWPSTLPGELHGPTTTLPPDATPEEAEALLEPSRRTVTVEISPAPDPVVTVSIDFHDGNGTREVLSTPAPQPVPETYKFGFAASTGAFTDVHLIRNVVVHPAAELPDISLVKQIPADAGLPQPVEVGTRVPYEYVVTNAGGTVLTGVTVTDDHVTDVACPETTLAPGQSVTCTGSYVVTAADGTAGSVTNTAVADGTSGGATITSPPDSVTVGVAPAPSASIALDKSAPPGPYAVGDTVMYDYLVTNTGGTAIEGLVVEDDLLASVDCPVTALAPGESTTCTGAYVVTEADAGAGFVTNIATASGDSGGVPVVSPPDEVTVPVEPEDGGLSLVKTAKHEGPYKFGDKVHYRYTVTNETGRTLDGLTVDDDLVADVACPDTTLEPGESVTCTGTYRIEKAPGVCGWLTNTAVATAGGVRSHEAKATVLLKKPCDKHPKPHAA
ncbi:lectin-like domain-containing protein [Streptomyces sp. MS19]|uniref:DUF7507 domain-containing protein n=1 Tax=Streptomyces sp. MS19 TaxID=3385972 RepID=UPI0039A125A7